MVARYHGATQTKERFMIYTQVGNIKAVVHTQTFPGGEVMVRLVQKLDHADKVSVVAHIKNSDDVMALLLTVDAIRREKSGINISLELPYIPYARQDRVCNEGESLSIAVMASLINSCEFSSIHVIDPHSDVAPALIKNVVIKSQEEVFGRIYQDWRAVYIVAPDAGAYKKSHKFAQSVGAAGVVVCNKIRDVKTGKIEGVSCTEDVAGKHLLVLDDLCDGGRTFVEVVSLLKDASRLDLAVTHGIFSKGVEVVASKFNNVYTTNSFHGIVPENLKATNVKWMEV